MSNIEWHGAKVEKAIEDAMDDVSKSVAKNVMKDAKRILRKKAKTTTARGLLSQFDVRKSKFKGGGYLVTCQGSGNWRPPYHASFVEMGTHSKDPKHPHEMEAKPFLRPAYKKHKRKADRMFQKALDKL